MILPRLPPPFTERSRRLRPAIHLGGRLGTVSWTDQSGNFWLFGGNGYDADGMAGYLNDLWEFNPSTNEWAWMGGSSVAAGSCPQTAFTCGQPGVYGTLLRSEEHTSELQSLRHLVC